MRSTPVEERLALAPAAPGGRFTPNGVASFISRFSTQESLNEFLRWRENPVTMSYLAALRALSANVPAAYLNRENVELQYGLQCGLSLAVSLMDDPTSMYPQLFMAAPTSGSPEAGESSTVYSTAPDSLE